MEIHLNKHKKSAMERGRTRISTAMTVAPKERATYDLKSSSSKKAVLSKPGTTKGDLSNSLLVLVPSCTKTGKICIFRCKNDINTIVDGKIVIKTFYKIK